MKLLCGEHKATRRERRRSRMVAQHVRESGATRYAEIGVDTGYTATLVADTMPANSEMHLFDFQDVVEPVADIIANKYPYINVYAYGNSRKQMDSYCWSLGKLLASRKRDAFDFVFLDGIHDWARDGFAFLLIDRLLVVPGWVEFDDRNHRYIRPKTFARHQEDVERWYTHEQASCRQVAMVIDLLAKPDQRYRQIVEDRLFVKERH